MCFPDLGVMAMNRSEVLGLELNGLCLVFIYLLHGTGHVIFVLANTFYKLLLPESLMYPETGQSYNKSYNKLTEIEIDKSSGMKIG